MWKVINNRINKEDSDHTKTEKLIKSNPLSKRLIEISEVSLCLNLF